MPARRQLPLSFNFVLWFTIAGSFAVLLASPAAIAQEQEAQAAEQQTAPGAAAPAATAESPGDAASPQTPSTAQSKPAETTAVQPGTIQSPASEPPKPARPVEEELEHTAEGKIRFNFQGQRWLDVLQWLAKSSKLTLDWQELPATELNLATQQDYSLDEARDLLNMHLASRGFTLLRRGEVLTLVKLDQLNPILVPRVSEEELDTRDLHEIVRVSLPLDWLVAEEAVKEFTPMLSPFGKLVPMKATNRLEAMDTVANLQGLRRLLEREQSQQGEERLVVEFKLKYAVAQEIVEKLRGLLGVENTSRVSTGDRMRMQMEKTRATAELAKNLGKEAANIMRRDPEVHLVVNESENSILANAPPDKMAIIRQAIEALDVASSGTRPGVGAATKMKIYRTKAIDPDTMAEMINELVEAGKLQSNTHVEADDDSNTLIVYAVPEDHLAIANLVSQIDDDGRDVRIIELRDLEPEYAVQAIKLLLQGGTDEGGEGRRWWRRAMGSEDFRIEADVDRKRLLLWASDEEYDQVKGLLAKLGEDAGQTAARSRVRVLNLPAQNAEQALQRLERIWPNLRDNPLQIDDPVESTARKPAAKRSAFRDDAPPAENPGKRLIPKVTKDPANATDAQSALPLLSTQLAFLQANRDADQRSRSADPNTDADRGAPNTQHSDQQPRGESIDDAAGAEAPAITVTEGPDGQLIISSKDQEALDAMEELLREILPQQSDYHVFKLQHASPMSIELTLRELFGVDAKTAPTSRSRLQTGAPRQLQFISDLDTGTLLVQGATEDQLSKITELVKLYDQPETLDEKLQRKTEIYQVQYSRASAVATTVKDAYRDLLSSDDKAFEQKGEKGDAPSRSVGYGGNYASTIPKFKGLLSIGVEDNTNTLVISAPEFLLGDVMELVQKVDRTASGYGVRVLRSSGVGAEQLRSVLSGVPGATTTSSGAAKPEKPATTAPATGQPAASTPANASPATSSSRGASRNRQSSRR